MSRNFHRQSGPPDRQDYGAGAAAAGRRTGESGANYCL
jgi:hypothetical protein